MVGCSGVSQERRCVLSVMRMTGNLFLPACTATGILKHKSVCVYYIAMLHDMLQREGWLVWGLPWVGFCSS